MTGGAGSWQLIGAATEESRFRIRDARGLDIAEIQVVRRASEAAFADLVAGRTTIGATTRTISAAELAGIANRNVRAQITGSEQVLGLDGIAAIVTPGHPVQRLGAIELARMVSGEVSDWSAFGLPQRPIAIVAGAEPNLEGLAAIARPGGLRLSPAATRVSDDAEVSDAVTRDASAVGLASVSQLRSARALDIQLACGIVARPTDFAIKAEEYPLARRLLLYTNGQPAEPLAQEFIRFIGSRAGQPAVREGGVVDQSVSVAEASPESERILRALATGVRGDAQTLALTKRLAAEAAHARRLSLTFRFAIASSELDAKASGDIARLADMLREGELKGRTIMLAGFTDAAGKPDFNAGLSLKRAAQIREVLLSSLPDGRAVEGRILVRGFGPAAPVACNGGSSGQFLNRRVEVWLLDGADAAATQPVAAVGTGGTDAVPAGPQPRRSASGVMPAQGGQNTLAPVVPGGAGMR